MPFQKRLPSFGAACLWFACLLSGCATTSEPLPSHTVQVQVYRSTDASIGDYNNHEVAEVLRGARQALRDRGMDVTFDIKEDILIGDDWDDLYSQDIARIGTRMRAQSDAQLNIVITNKIWSCGSNSYQTTVILGCTPVGTPVVVVQGKVNGALNNYGTSDSILWLHEMGHSVQLGHTSSTWRVMTPAPRTYSNQLERFEVKQYANLGEKLPALVVEAAMAVPMAAASPSQTTLDMAKAQDRVRQAGLHGLDLQWFAQLSDEQLLALQSLLTPGESTTTQANAVAVMGQLGGEKSVAYVMTYLAQKPASAHREVKEAGLVALAMNNNPAVTERTLTWLMKATGPSYWCSANASGQELQVCDRLAHISIGALAQSQQPMAQAYLQKMAQSPAVPRKPASLRPRPTLDNETIQTEARTQEMDVAWSAIASQKAQKFLRKRQAAQGGNDSGQADTVP